MSEDTRTFLPLDSDLVEVLSADTWNLVGTTCRLALVKFRLEGDDLTKTIGEMLDSCPDALLQMLDARAAHRKVLQRALALLRAADRHEKTAYDLALAERVSDGEVSRQEGEGQL